MLLIEIPENKGRISVLGFFSYFIKKRKMLATLNAFHSKSLLWLVVRGQNEATVTSWVWPSISCGLLFEKAVALQLIPVSSLWEWEVGKQEGGSYKWLYCLPLLQGAANITHTYFKVQIVVDLLLLGFIPEYIPYFLFNTHGIIRKSNCILVVYQCCIQQKYFSLASFWFSFFLTLHTRRKTWKT